MDIKKPLALAAGAALLSVGGLTAVPALAATASAAPAVTHRLTGVWPAQATGRPSDLKAFAATGYYIWHDRNGWTLEVTHQTKTKVVFSGTVTSNGTIGFKRVDDEKADRAKVGPDGHTLGFRFVDHGHIDGVHFATKHASELTFDLKIGGATAGASTVRIGVKDLHPDRVPFTVTRTDIR